MQTKNRISIENTIKKCVIEQRNCYRQIIY